MLPGGVYNSSYEKDIAIVRTKTQWALLMLFLAFLFAFPWMPFASRSLLSFVIMMGIAVVSVHGLNMLTGYCGQISIGHSAFMAVGAYTSALLAVNFGFSFWLALPIAGLGAAMAGVVFGLPALRVKGFYLALATLAAQFIILYMARQFADVTGGVRGLAVPAPEIGGFIFDSRRSYYYIVIVIAIIATFFAKNIARTGIGRAFIAIRDNDLAAEVMGINLYFYKLLSFFIGCFFAGIAGSLLAHFVGHIGPDHFTLKESIWYLGYLIVGGMGSTSGVIFGVVFLFGLNRIISMALPFLAGLFPGVGAQIFSSSGLIIFGMVIILFLIFEPRGLSHRWDIFKSYYRLWPFSY